MMPYYNLAVVNEPGRVLSTAAKDRKEALAIFGKAPDTHLTLNNQEMPAPYLLYEWQNCPHWINPTIPVFEISS